MANTEITADPGTLEITISREFDAPIDLVFRAHTEAELVAQWVGPDRLTCEVTDYEARHGGTWRMVHSDGAGMEAAFRGVFHGEPAPALTMRTFEWEGMPGHVSFETLRLEDLGDGRTRAVNVSVFQTIADRDGMAASGMEVGVTEGYVRLDKILANLP